MSFVTSVHKCNTENTVLEKRQTTELNSSKKTKPTLCQNLHSYFTQYCEASSMHGVRYIGETGRFLIEKLFWAAVVITVCYFCTDMILKAYHKWKTLPVIVSFATTETPISKIPFPAVTICPEVKTDPNVFNFSEVLLKRFLDQPITAEEHKYFESISLVCSGMDENLTAELYKNLKTVVNESVLEDMLTVLPQLNNETLMVWLGKTYSFSDMLSTVYTSEGVCYSFNMLDYEELYASDASRHALNARKLTKKSTWTLDGGYPKNDKLVDVYPVRSVISGVNAAAMFYLYTNRTHLDYLCGESLQGFKVALHHPMDQPDMDVYFQVPLDEAVLVAVKPKMITVSNELKSYSPEARKCYFLMERNLTFFRSYTQKNCLDECFSNYTMKRCGCVAFHMPRFATTPICGSGNKLCFEESKVEFILDETDSKNPSAVSSCNCLPTCTSLQYEVEISQSHWDWRHTFSVVEQILDRFTTFPYNDETAQFSKLVVYYKEMQFLSSERHEVYGHVEFFSNAGGLLGLFIGFSVTSAIEVLYFLTLRLVCNIKKFGGPFWAGQ